MRRVTKSPFAVLRLCRARDEDVHAAVMELGRMGNRRALRALRRALDSQKVRNYAIAALLASENPEAKRILIEVLEQQHPARWDIIAAVAAAGDPKFVAPLVRILKSDPDPSLRGFAARALGTIGGSEAFQALAEAAAMEKQRIAHFSITEAIGRGGADTLPILVQILLDPDSPLESQAIAARRLGEVGGPDVVPYLAQALSRDDLVQREAILSLVKIGTPDATSVLLGALDGGEIRSLFILPEVIRYLGEARVQEAVPALRRFLLEPHEWGVRKAAAEALGRIGGRAAVQAILEYLDSGDGEVRPNAVAALAGDREGISLVSKILPGEARDVRASAVRIIGSLYASRKATVLLARMARSEHDPNVLQAILEAVRSSCYPETLGALVMLARVSATRDRALRELGKIGSVQAITVLMKLLPDADVARALAKSVAQHGPGNLLTAIARKGSLPSDHESSLVLAIEEVEDASGEWELPPDIVARAVNISPRLLSALAEMALAREPVPRWATIVLG